ncbi:MAG: 30S ribosome-binding factor RbfA [Erysipelotrichaceae bacterium]|nr:30S ribosome-binding factor RbfA [Erysipelotrichaceae bacterium]
MNARKERNKQQLIRDISSIIQYDLKDPEIGFVTVIDAHITNDFSYAKIYVSFIGDNKNFRLKRLNRAKGYIRTQLASRSHLRKTPELTFYHDETMETGERIEQILEKIKQEE